MTDKNIIDDIVARQKAGEAAGIPSVCSSHPIVLEAAVRFNVRQGTPLLVESTSNQVNQFGGYTGMKPADFMAFMRELADKHSLSPNQLTLGGDHLGPLVWHKEPAEEAMRKAADLVKAYVEAGFTKIHLDCSMPLGGDTQLPVELVAQRTAALARVAELAASDPGKLRYIVGSEVPAAGGSKDEEEQMSVTSPAAAAETIAAIQLAFETQGLQEAWSRVRGLVVQPGVEFGENQIHDYKPEKAEALSQMIETVPGMVFEAHSTDYQTPLALKKLVEDHFAILKVGPGLTFALREGLVALAMIESQLLPQNNSRIIQTLEHTMVEKPGYWQEHYHGDADHQRLSRWFSFSDRIRYYWANDQVSAAEKQLYQNLDRTGIPLTLLSQYMPAQFRKVRAGTLAATASALLIDKVEEVLEDYAFAVSNR